MKPDGRSAQILWRFGGAQFSRTIRCAHEREAQRACSLVEVTIQDIGRGRLAVPPDVDAGDFLFSGGRAVAAAGPISGRKRPVGPATLDELFEAYRTAPPPHLEPSTRKMVGIHFRKLLESAPTRALKSWDVGSAQ